MKWMFLMTALGLTTLGHSAYKKFAVDRQTLYLLAAIVMLVGAPFATYMAIRSGLSVAQVYMATAFIPVLMLATGRYWFGEDVGIHHGIGVFLIIAGVAIFYY